MSESLFPIPSIVKETVNGTQTFSLNTTAFNDRKMYLFGEVTNAMLYSFTQQFMYLTQDKNTPIDIYINSPGGEVLSGLAIYNLLQSCETPVNLYCVGFAASMGAIIFAGGQKGHRFILPHSQVMIHEPLLVSGVSGSASSIQSTAESILATREILNGILAKHTGKTIKQINTATREDNWLTAEEAVSFGIADSIVSTVD